MMRTKSAAITIENSFYRVEVEPPHGLITRIHDKAGRIELITEPRLAENFRLLLPEKKNRSNYIHGGEQKLTSVERDSNSLTLHWKGPLKNTFGRFALDVMLRIELAGEAIHFHCEVRNHSKLTLAEVWYPILGGIRGFGRGRAGRDAELLVPTANRSWRQPIFRDFGSTHTEALGTLSGEHAFAYPGILPMPWVSFFHEKEDRALWFASLEETPRVRYVRFAQSPGLAQNRLRGTWPRDDEARGFPTGLTMNWAHFPFTPPGQKFKGSTIVLQYHRGGWKESAALYRDWFVRHFPPVDSRSCWLRAETATLDAMFLLPEDNVNFRFREIPRWAKTAADHGLKAVLISGWSVGGHDRGYPQYTPDPKLGTWTELESGVRACHRLGLRVYFFVNCQPADMSTDWYRKELHKFRLLDPYGQQYFIVNYWGMGTLSARVPHCTATPFGELNPAHPEVRKLLIERFRRLAEIGADGVHIDKFFGTPFDFNPRLKGASPDRVHHEGILRFTQELLATCRAINPEFAFSHESAWDRLIQYSDVSWWGGAEDDVWKAVFPQRTLTIGITQPYDFNRVNLAVLRGVNMLVGPGNYMRGMDYAPMKPLCRYIAEVVRIRRDLHGALSRGEILDASEGLYRRKTSLVKMSGASGQSAQGKWALFRDIDSGRKALVLVNPAESPLGPRDSPSRDATAEAARSIKHSERTLAQLSRWTSPFHPSASSSSLRNILRNQKPPSKDS